VEESKTPKEKVQMHRRSHEGVNLCCAVSFSSVFVLVGEIGVVEAGKRDAVVWPLWSPAGVSNLTCYSQDLNTLPSDTANQSMLLPLSWCRVSAELAHALHAGFPAVGRSPVMHACRRARKSNS